MGRDNKVKDSADEEGKEGENGSACSKNATMKEGNSAGWSLWRIVNGIFTVSCLVIVVAVLIKAKDMKEELNSKSSGHTEKLQGLDKQLKELRKEKNQLKETLVEREKSWKSAFDEQKSSANSAKEEKKNALKKVEQLVKELEASKDALELATSDKGTCDQAQKEMEQNLETLKAQQQKKIEEVGVAMADLLKEKENAVAKCTQDIQASVSKSTEERDKRIRDLEHHSKTQEQSLNEFVAKVESLNANLATLTQQKHAADEISKGLETTVADLRSQLNKAAEEKKALASESGQVKSLQDQLAKSQADLNAANTKAAEADTLRAQAASLNKDLEATKAQLAKANTDSSLSTQQKSTLEAQLAEVRKEVASLKEANTKLQQEKDQAIKNQQQSASQANTEAVSKAQKEAGDCNAQLNTVKNELGQAVNGKSQKETELANRVKEVQALSQEKQKLTAEKQAVEKQLADERQKLIAEKQAVEKQLTEEKQRLTAEKQAAEKQLAEEKEKQKVAQNKA